METTFAFRSVAALLCKVGALMIGNLHDSFIAILLQ